MKRTRMMVFHSVCRGVEIFWYNSERQFVATFDGRQMMSPDYKIIRRAIRRRLKR